MTNQKKPKPIEKPDKDIGTMAPKGYKPTGVNVQQAMQNQARNYMTQLLTQHHRVSNPNGIPPLLQMLIEQQANQMSQPTRLNPTIVERRRETNRLADMMRRMGKL